MEKYLKLYTDCVTSNHAIVRKTNYDCDYYLLKFLHVVNRLKERN